MNRFKAFVTTAIVVLGGGLIGLWLYQTKTLNKLRTTEKSSSSGIVSSLPEAEPKAEETGSAFSLLEEGAASLQASLSSLLARVEELEKSSQTQSIPTTSTQTTPAFQPQTIFLGSASSNKRSWTDSGVEIMLNSADYPADVSTVFEAGLSIVGGEAWARLRNKTTGAVMSITEVMHNNSTVAWKTSPSFKLHSGNNVYVVQLRSSSGESAYLSGARLKLSR
jgi:hypothetical protein